MTGPPLVEAIRQAEQRLAAAETAALVGRLGVDRARLLEAVRAARAEVITLRRAARAVA